MEGKLFKFTLTLELELEGYHEDDIREQGYDLAEQSGAQYSSMHIEQHDDSNPWELAGMPRR
jgi:hypothetical protein